MDNPVVLGLVPRLIGGVAVMITPTTPATGSMVGNHAGLETTSATTTIVGLQVVNSGQGVSLL